MNKLDQLSELRARLDVLTDDRLAECAAVLAAVKPQLAAVKPQLDAINERYAPQLAETADTITALENDIRLDVLQYGVTVKGAHLQAVWMKGRQSWDSARLEGYAVAHPEIAQFRKVGEPSVTIRSVS